MATTTTYAFRYPALTDAPNGPQAFQQLAEDVEAELNRRMIRGRQRRTTNISTAGAITRTVATSAAVVAGRTYRVWSQFEIDCTAVPATSQCEVRYTTNGVDPTVTDAILCRALIGHQTAAVPDSVHVDGLFVCTANATLKVVLCIARPIGSGTITLNAASTSPCELVIEDMGRTVTAAGTVY